MKIVVDTADVEEIQPGGCFSIPTAAALDPRARVSSSSGGASA